MLKVLPTHVEIRVHGRPHGSTYFTLGEIMQEAVYDESDVKNRWLMCNLVLNDGFSRPTLWPVKGTATLIQDWDNPLTTFRPTPAACNNNPVANIIWWAAIHAIAELFRKEIVVYHDDIKITTLSVQEYQQEPTEDAV